MQFICVSCGIPFPTNIKLVILSNKKEYENLFYSKACTDHFIHLMKENIEEIL